MKIGTCKQGAWEERRRQDYSHINLNDLLFGTLPFSVPFMSTVSQDGNQIHTNSQHGELRSRFSKYCLRDRWLICEKNEKLCEIDLCTRVPRRTWLKLDEVHHVYQAVKRDLANQLKKKDGGTETISNTAECIRLCMNSSDNLYNAITYHLRRIFITSFTPWKPIGLAQERYYNVCNDYIISRVQIHCLCSGMLQVDRRSAGGLQVSELLDNNATKCIDGTKVVN